MGISNPLRKPSRSIRLGAAVTLAFTLLAACGDDESALPVDDLGFVHAQADPVIAGQDLETWKTFADQVSVVTVVDSKRGEPMADWPERFVTRELTVLVDQNLYINPPRKTFGAGETEQYSPMGWGEKVEERTLTPVRVDGGVNMEVGGTYLVAYADAFGAFGPLNSAAVIELVDGSALLPEVFVDWAPLDGDDENVRPAAVDLQGQSVDEIERSIEAVRLDPEIQALLGFDLADRVREVYEAKNP